MGFVAPGMNNGQRVKYHKIMVGLRRDIQKEVVDMVNTLNFRIVGVAPLVMHNGALADPRYEYTRKIKAISSKRMKTDADYEEMARLEWFGGLYLFNGEPCVPSYVLEAMLIGRGGAARKQKKGKEAAAGLFVVQDFPLEYEGPRDPKELWKLEQFRLVAPVKVQTSRIMRTRPLFAEWAFTAEVTHNPELVNEDEVVHWMQIAGEQVGLMDWRPKYGRFSVKRV